MWLGVATKISSTLTETPGMSRSTSATNPWKVCAALHSPKGITRDSNNPHGVVVAVRATLSSCMGTWLNARTRSSLEKTVLSARAAGKSFRRGSSPADKSP